MLKKLTRKEKEKLTQFEIKLVDLQLKLPKAEKKCKDAHEELSTLKTEILKTFRSLKNLRKISI